ncbi:ABC transporter ATP-binding protein [Fulvimarina sp. 2208YS6-2-32]|uniref:ABC transporter ATP-binding protein n=1 Tax=Fulvimarina uroteuthidis TaxID=3098149 RepID=A0ABU5I1T3_9HYPH|nr:ABC transporter ATP-binding protein [Fulvimarina sp. 2208YS6-2-32]MDY8109280.1 ABC transporter ATP-binding protein [Fulvimarina sp. 2208YS6-2-32]
MSGLRLRSVVKRFDDTPVVNDVSLDVKQGEFVALLGPSGCGKTTLLRLVAGFERLSEGAIEADGELFSDPGRHVPPEKRNIAIVFQSYALWPHLNVGENVGYPLRVRGVSRADRDAAVKQALSVVGLEQQADRRPADLSGGQRQRVALARCLVMEPRIVLLDEPLANLDVALRASMEETFRQFHEKTGATMVYVTHDQAEAMALADRIAVMEGGRIRQVDAPTALYARPATESVARFIGDSRVVDATILEAVGDDRYRVEALGAHALVRGRPGRQPGPARLSLRGGDFMPDEAGPVVGQVRRSVFRGGHFVVSLDLAASRGGAVAGEGDAVEVHSSVSLAHGERMAVSITDGWLVG